MRIISAGPIIDALILPLDRLLPMFGYRPLKCFYVINLARQNNTRIFRHFQQFFIDNQQFLF